MRSPRAGAVFVLIAVLALVATVLPKFAAAQSAADVAAKKAQLQAQLDELDKEISDLNTNLQGAQKQQNTLEGDLKILDDEIQSAKLAIERRNLTIQSLSQGIQDKQDTISGLDDKLQNEYDSLGAIMREMDQLDTASPVLQALASKDISEFFADIDQFNAVNESMQNSFSAIKTDRNVNEQQKTDLQNQLDEETQLRQVQQLQQQNLQSAENQKNQILAATKGQEKAYQNLIANKQQSAAQIRAALFELTGTKAIPFEQALQYANLAEQKTGIRPAFLLGLITEESNLGQNVGTGNWQVDMNPTRDRPIFAVVTQSLGLDPNSMPVSKKAWYGWGGAMGPAQFIPSTWALYAGYPAPGYAYDPSKDRVGALTGNHPANPWNPEDAFMAAAIYLTDDGADAQTPNAEFKAAMCYLAGCGGVNNKDLQFYGNDVAALAAKYQQEIDILNGN